MEPLRCVVEIPAGSRNTYESDPERKAVVFDRFVSADRDTARAAIDAARERHRAARRAGPGEAPAAESRPRANG